MALARKVERVPRIDADQFVLGGVIDFVLAGEFQLPSIIPAVESHSSLGQGHAQVIVAAVLELLHHPHFRIGLRPKGVLRANRLHRPVPVIHINFPSVVYIDRLGLNARSAYKLDLLGFAVVQGRRTFERVEVIFIKCSFGDLRPSACRGCDDHGLSRRIGLIRLNLVYVPGHQLDPCIPKCLPALIVQRDPA